MCVIVCHHVAPERDFDGMKRVWLLVCQYIFVQDFLVDVCSPIKQILVIFTLLNTYGLSTRLLQHLLVLFVFNNIT